MWHLNLINVQRRDGKWILRRILNYAPHVNRSMACRQYPLSAPAPPPSEELRELQLRVERERELQLRPQVALKGTVQLAAHLGTRAPRLLLMMHSEGQKEPDECRQRLLQVFAGSSLPHSRSTLLFRLQSEK